MCGLSPPYVMENTENIKLVLALLALMGTLIIQVPVVLRVPSDIGRAVGMILFLAIAFAGGGTFSQVVVLGQPFTSATNLIAGAAAFAYSAMAVLYFRHRD